MKFKCLLSLALLLSSGLVSAGTINREEAKTRAISFLNQTAASGKMKAPARLNASMLKEVMADDSAYYVFNVSNNGFVIASASDKTQPVLGYSDSGTFSIENMPVQLRLWLKKLSEGVRAVNNNTVAATGRAQKVVRKARQRTRNAIPTLVTARWNQGSPYNLFTPYYRDDNGNMTSGDNRSATGCVATAMSQVMYYWKWPQDSTAVIPGYSSDWNMQRTLDPLPKTKFDWANMQDTYNDASSQVSKEAVAELMIYVGHSIGMGYGPASGAYSGNCATALRNYYGYNKNLYFAPHDNYTYDGWEDLIYSELAKGHPLLMAGDNSDLTGGHEWVCDGYDGNGCFHMNWGWGGMDDGYFVLTVMSPDNQGIGGSTSSDGYSMSQNICVGVEPDYGQTSEEEDVRLSLANVRTPRPRYTRKSNDVAFSPVFYYTIATKCNYTHHYDHIFSLYNDKGELLKDSLSYNRNRVLQPGGRSESMANMTLDKNLPNGTYYFRGKSREHTDDNSKPWVEDYGYDDYYVKAVVDNDTLTLSAFPTPCDLQGDTIVLEGSGCVGTEQRVRARVTNHGGQEFYGNMFLLAGTQWKSGNCVQVPGNSTVDLYFKYTPDQAGDVTLSLSTTKNTQAAFFNQTVKIDTASETTLRVRSNIVNQIVNSNVYGNIAKVAVTVTNTGDAAYKNNIRLTPWHLVGNMYWFSGGENRFITLDPGKDTTLVYNVTGLDFGEQYCFHAEAAGVKDANNNSATVKFVKGIDYWTSDGEMHSIAPTSGRLYDENVTAIRLYGTSNVPTVRMESTYNPNVIVYYDEGATIPTRVLNVLKRKVKNIVFGSSADEVVFNDTAAVVVPIQFTAKKATFTHSADSKTNWSTLVLPFSPTTIADETGKNLDWFHSSTDTGKDFHIMEFSEANGSELYFSDVDSLIPARPYIVNWAGNEDASLAGHAVTFSASDVTIAAPEYISTYSKDYKFVGSLTGDSLTNVYTLNSDGTAFVLTPSAVVSPFSAWFVANNENAALVQRLNIHRPGLVTGIDAVTADKALVNGATNVYTLSGVLVATITNASQLDKLPRGMYIVGGRKVICGK